MSRAAPPITQFDGPVRAALRDLLSLRAVQAELAPYKLAAGFGRVDRALDVVLAADRERGNVVAAFALPRPALEHQLRLVLATG